MTVITSCLSAMSTSEKSSYSHLHVEKSYYTQYAYEFQTMIIDNQVRDNATVVAALFVTSAAFLNLHAAGMHTSAKIMEEFLQKHKRKQHLSKFHRRGWVREHFSSFRERTSSTLFRRMFRMPENTFEILCKQIEASVGEEEFCSENFITTKL